MRQVFGRGERIALGHELRGDSLAVTLVHLATAGFSPNSDIGIRAGQGWQQQTSLPAVKGANPCRPDWAWMFVRLSKFLHQ